MPRLFAPTSQISTVVAESSLAQGGGRDRKLKAIDSLRLHWPEYLMEAFGLPFTCVLSGHSQLIMASRFARPLIYRRRHTPAALMGLGIGTVLIAVVVSPWGRRSGGHLNPAMTLAFCRLGKLELWDMLFYVGSQFLGALTGVLVAAYVLRGALGNVGVHYAVTAPGVYGGIVAFVAEVMVSFVLMSTILFVYAPDELGVQLIQRSATLLHSPRRQGWFELPGKLHLRPRDRRCGRSGPFRFGPPEPQEH
jgi:glycerol uptake facilitator-like aquaporin